MVDLTKFSIVDTGHTTRNAVKKICPFDFTSNKSNRCVVTVGDSWTWGADMTHNDDEHHRLTKHYGRLVADNLGADWLNLGQGGSGNFWIYDRVRELAEIIPTLNYQQIYVVCTLTEVGRAVDARQDIDFYNFFKTNKIENFLSYLNSVCINNIITSLEPFGNVTLRIGTNFVDCSERLSLPQSWLELLCKKYQVAYHGKCHVVSPWVVTGLRQLINLMPKDYRNEYLNLLNELLDTALQRENLIRSVPIMRNLHPTAPGHAVWADYILQHI